MTDPDERSVAEVADAVALGDSGHTSARPTHRIITEHLWRTLRTLGFSSGRVLVHGDDPATFLGQPHTLGFGLESLTATVLTTHQPGNPIQAEVFTDVAENFDLVIAAVPFNDVKLAYPLHQLRRQTLEHAVALASVDFTKPGGLTVILASHELLDFSGTHVRREIAAHADLIGAVRLPGGIQRNVAGTDAATDLILLHRAANSDRPSGPGFTGVRPVVVDGRMLLANTYFHDHPNHVLGTIGVEPVTDRPNALSVTAGPARFAANLAAALDDIATTARHSGLSYSAGARALGMAAQTPEPIDSEGARPAGESARGHVSESAERDPDWDDPDLAEPGLGLW